MNRLAARILGYALPTIGFVTALHLRQLATPGEAVDGVVSGAAFTLPFAAVAWLRSRLEGGRASARARSAGTEFVFGLISAAVAWAALWVGWSLPEVQRYRPQAFAINCVVMALAGLMLPAAARRERQTEGSEPTEAGVGAL